MQIRNYLWTILFFTLVLFTSSFFTSSCFAQESNKNQIYSIAPNDDVIKSIKALHKNPVKELARLNALITSQPTSSKLPEWQYVSALGYEKVGQREKANALLQSCLDNTSTSPLLQNRAKLLKAKLLSDSGDKQAAISLLKDVLSWSDSQGIVQLKIGALMTMGTIFESMLQVELSLESYFEAYKIASEVKTQVPAAHIAGLVGRMYQKQQDHIPALRYLNESFAFAQKKQNIVNQGNLSFDIAYSEYMLKRFQKALKTADNAYSISTTSGDKNLATKTLILKGRILTDIGSIKNLSDAYQLFLQATDSLSHKKAGSMLFDAQLGLANIEFIRGNYQNAINTLEELQQPDFSNLDMEQRVRFHTLIANVYKAIKDYERAYMSLNDLVKLKTEYILNVNSTRADIMKTLFELDRTKKENTQLKAITASQARALSISKQRNLLFGVSSILLVLLASTLFLFYRRKVRYQYILEKLATTDGLTRLYNRRKIIDILNALIDGNQNQLAHTSVAMVDIDYFKSINDNYGHQRGDDTLILFAREAEAQLGDDCHVGRIGGEEFLIIFESLSTEGAKSQLDKLQQSLAAKAKAQFGEDFTLTFSGGILSAQNQATSSSILEKVDAALYQAKTTGRNKVICV